ncbi:MAG: hypothetical protein IJM26_06765 [Lachnospiraceae bacterium]|nr:hypothetical protein [Lachnospiraceae bacterium]
MNLNREWLADAGVYFEQPADEQAFLHLMQEQYELRVGESMCQELSPEQEDEFERMIDDKEDDVAIAAWLNRNCPDYRDLITQAGESLQEELRSHRAEIGDSLWPESALNETLESFGLPAVDACILREEGIRTVGELLVTPMSRLGDIARRRPIHMDIILPMMRPFRLERVRTVARLLAEITRYEEVRRDYSELEEAKSLVDSLLEKGTPVRHERYGPGKVVSQYDGRLTIRFRSGTSKYFSLHYKSSVDNLEFDSPETTEAVRRYCQVSVSRHAKASAWYDVKDRMGSYLPFLEKSPDSP